MRVLLDECLPERLGQELAPHEVKTVKQAGLAGRKDGALLLGVIGRFDVFLTSIEASNGSNKCDRSISLSLSFEPGRIACSRFDL